MKESNVIDMFTVDAEIPVVAVKGSKRDRGYLRMQRDRKIMERTTQAQKANIEVMALGQLAKTSPFSLVKCSRDLRRSLKVRRSLSVQVQVFQEAA